jgi:hypothetical protein
MSRWAVGTAAPHVGESGVHMVASDGEPARTAAPRPWSGRAG